MQVEIAKRHLIPEALRQCGVSTDQISLSDSALYTLISRYCRESGVRNLQKQLDKVLRKSARQIVEAKLPQTIQVCYTVTKHLKQWYSYLLLFTG